MDWTLLNFEKLDDWVLEGKSTVENVAKYTVNHIICNAYMNVSNKVLRKLSVKERYRHLKIVRPPETLAIERD
tara:strand:- start:9025 stop:9243 length:219 start_codon:yes stop_codon:yes gene_type:complete